MRENEVLVRGVVHDKQGDVIRTAKTVVVPRPVVQAKTPITDRKRIVVEGQGRGSEFTAGAILMSIGF